MFLSYLSTFLDSFLCLEAIGYRLLGGLLFLHGLVHFLCTTGPSVTKVVYAEFDRVSNCFSFASIPTILTDHTVGNMW